MPKSNVSVGWGSRVESVDDAADRVARLVTALAGLDPALTGWRGGRTKSAEMVVTTDHADLVERLLEGRTRGDTANEVIESLGYSVVWCNGADDHRAVQRRCGSILGRARD